MADRESLADTLSYYTGPHLGGFLKGVLGVANEINPVNSIGRSMQASRDEVFAPGKTPMERIAGTGDMLTGMAEVVAPAAAGKIAKLPMNQLTGTIGEGLTGFSSSVSTPVTAFARGEAGNVPLIPDYMQPPPQTARRTGTGDLFYSQAEQAAIDLAQKKGTVGQFRGQLSKAGVKPDEFLWSGFDNAFSDPNQKVSKEDLIEYFRNTNSPVEFSTKQATGTVGQPLFDEDNAYGAFYENNLYDEDMREGIIENMVSDLQSEGMTLGEMREVNPEAYQAQVNQYGEDVLSDDMFWHNGEIIRGDLDTYVRDNMDNEISDQMDRAIADDWENYGRDAEREAYAEMGMFDPGDTQYSENFTRGAENYRENVFHPTSDARERAFGRAPEDVYRAPHFAGDSTDLSLHTRAGELPVGDGRQTAYHLGEVQSDYAQKNRGKIRSPEQERDLASLMDQVLEAESRNQIARAGMERLAGEGPNMRLAGRMLSEDRPGQNRSVLTNPNTSRYDQQYMLENFARTAPGTQPAPVQFSRGTGHHVQPTDPLNPWDPNLLRTTEARSLAKRAALRDNTPTDQLSFGDITSPPVDENGFVDLGQLDNWEAERATSAWPPTARNNFTSDDLGLQDGPIAALNQDGYLPEKAMRQSAYRSNDPGQPALPLGYSAEQEQLADIMGSYATNKIDAESAMGAADSLRRGTVPAAPYVTTTDKWVDAGLRQGLADALTGTTGDGISEFDYMTLSNPGMAEEMTYLPGDAESSGKFYGSIVPGRMQKLLDKVAPGQKVQMVDVQTESGTQSVPAVALTEELRQLVEKNGIPYYSIGGGLAVLGASAAGQGREEPGT